MGPFTLLFLLNSIINLSVLHILPVHKRFMSNETDFLRRTYDSWDQNQAYLQNMTALYFVPCLDHSNSRVTAIFTAFAKRRVQESRDYCSSKNFSEIPLVLNDHVQKSLLCRKPIRFMISFGIEGAEDFYWKSSIDTAATSVYVKFYFIIYILSDLVPGSTYRTPVSIC